MNIFVLDKNPVTAASMHCDQHLHKMILESAQMLSTMVHLRPEFEHIRSHVYKPTHVNHPCNVWLRADMINAQWVIALCYALDDIRLGLGSDNHASMSVVQAVRDNLESDFGTGRPEFIYCGDLVSGTTVIEKYHSFYAIKHNNWLGTRSQMSYRNRPLPAFMMKYAAEIVHKEGEYL